MMNRYALVAACVLVASPTWAAPSAWLAAKTADMHETTGTFRQVDYGYSVTPPPGVAAYVTDGGTGEHGVQLIIGEMRSISVYPQFNGPDLANIQPCARDQLPVGSGRIVRGSVRLDRIKACEATVIGRTTCTRLIQGTRTDRSPEILYSLVLTTPCEDFRHDAILLDRVVSSFRTIPIGS